MENRIEFQSDNLNDENKILQEQNTNKIELNDLESKKIYVKPTQFSKKRKSITISERKISKKDTKTYKILEQNENNQFESQEKQNLEQQNNNNNKIQIHLYENNQKNKENQFQNTQIRLYNDQKQNLNQINSLILPHSNNKISTTINIISNEKIFNHHDISIKFGQNQLIVSQPLASFTNHSINIMTNDKNTILGTLQRNWIGSQYRLLSDGNVLCQFYFLNELSCQIQYKQVEVYIAQENIDSDTKLSKLNGLEKKVKKLICQQPINNNGNLMLNFNVKEGILSSTKNLILIDPTSSDTTGLLKMYKYQQNNQYQVVFQNPFTPLLAYCFILINLNFKLWTK